MQEPRHETGRLSGQQGHATNGAAAASFEDAYLQFGPKLRKIAIRKFGITPTDADTLVQDVFITYFQHAAAVEKLEPYLIGAICNASRNHLRRSGVANELFCDEEPCTATPDDEIEQTIERKHLVTRMLARVGDRCREMLHRYYVTGEDTQSIAEVMELTRGTVKVSLHKCRQRLREAYHAITERR